MLIIRWESQGYFKPNIDKGGDPFVVPMPPPNVTGSLHMGHAMFVTLEVAFSCNSFDIFALIILSVYLELYELIIQYIK